MLRTVVLLFLIALLPRSGVAMAKTEAPSSAFDSMARNRFECGGMVEEQVWSAWDRNIRIFLEQSLLQKRLVEQGDVYALYDFQTYAHNLVSMARRCNRGERLLEMARLVGKAYKVLAPGNFLSPGRRWICRGGGICNAGNRLLNIEVTLCSAQFLGLASSVAHAMAASRKLPTPEEKAFINETVEVLTEHLLRWGNRVTIEKLLKASKAKPDDVVDGSSTLFFTDQHLWAIHIYAELAGILKVENGLESALQKQSVTRLRQHLAALLQLFLARTSLQRILHSRLGSVTVAEIDRGYWRLYADNRYAGYEGEEKPVRCVPPENRAYRSRLEVDLHPSSVSVRQDIGWDFSHARRLVHALDAIERNRPAMHSVFSLPQSSLPSNELPLAFANKLVATVWNGDMVNPLFSNYWSGANGWYRVAYDNGTGDCREGDPPYGMSESFISGGYVTWARYRREVGLIGARLYMLVTDPDSERSPFIEKYYSSLSDSVSENIRALTSFMFLPTLVSVGIK